MKRFFYMAVAAMAALSSCTSENAGEEMKADGKADVFIATTGETRTILDATNTTDKGKVYWVKDEMISVNGCEYKAKEGGATTAEFEKVSNAAQGGTFKAYYPATLYNAGNPTLPDTYVYEEGKFNMPMYAESSDRTLSFKNICGVLAITVPASTMVKKIVVSSPDKALSGSFMVKEKTSGQQDYYAELTSAAQTAKGTITLSCTEAINTTVATTFYLAIPAQTYGGLKIKVYSDESTEPTRCMATTQKSITIERNKIYPIEYAPNAVQMWSGGPFFATKDCGGLTDSWGEGGSGYYGCYNGTDLEDGQIPAQYDNATVAWGNQWRMPTQNEYETLLTVSHVMSNRTTTFTASNGNSVVFYWSVGNYGDYWTSSKSTKTAVYISFNYQNNIIEFKDNIGRWNESPVWLVRAVLR